MAGTGRSFGARPVGKRRSQPRDLPKCTSDLRVSGAAKAAWKSERIGIPWLSA
jgi:hypothetical protein